MVEAGSDRTGLGDPPWSRTSANGELRRQGLLVPPPEITTDAMRAQDGTDEQGVRNGIARAFCASVMRRMRCRRWEG